MLEPFAQAFPTAFGPRDLLASAYADAGRLDDAVAAAAAALALAEAAGQESGTRAAVDGERRRQVLEALRQKLAALRAAAARNRGR